MARLRESHGLQRFLDAAVIMVDAIALLWAVQLTFKLAFASLSFRLIEGVVVVAAGGLFAVRRRLPGPAYWLAPLAAAWIAWGILKESRSFEATSYAASSARSWNRPSGVPPCVWHDQGTGADASGGGYRDRVYAATPPALGERVFLSAMLAAVEHADTADQSSSMSLYDVVADAIKDDVPVIRRADADSD